MRWRQLPVLGLTTALLLGCAGATGTWPGASDVGVEGGREVVDPGAGADRGVATIPDRSLDKEVCNNQVDDDEDGAVDEHCPCDGTVHQGQQDCYSGPIATRGIGACHVGTQRCLGDQEFKTWGLCVGEVTPKPEVEGDGIDNDCDGQVDAKGSCGGHPCPCALPWGGSLPDGGQVEAYAASSVACGGTCAKATRTCLNGVLSGSGASQTCGVAPCEALFTEVGRHDWVVPAGVTSVSAVCIGGGGGAGGYGGGGGGGALAYANNLAVVPGSVVPITVGGGGPFNDLSAMPFMERHPSERGGTSSFGAFVVAQGGENGRVNEAYASSTGLGGAGGAVLAGTGGAGGAGGRGGTGDNHGDGGGGGGAGGYAGSGGAGGVGPHGTARSAVRTPPGAGASGSGGAAGGGGACGYEYYGGAGTSRGGDGGGTGLRGQGPSGAGGTPTDDPIAIVDGCTGCGKVGGTGSTAQADASFGAGSASGDGSAGACRIIWPGSRRTFPSNAE